MFDFGYYKQDNTNLFKQMENIDLINIYNTQNYIPLYSKFFDINEKTFNTFNLKHKYFLTSLDKKISENTYSISITDHNTQHKTKTDTFIKYGGLYDPTNFLCGKFVDKNNNFSIYSNFYDLPNISSLETKKTNNPNYYFNNIYIDSFFSYLSSQLLTYHKFPNAINFYGSFIGIKNNFIYNSYDDFSYIRDKTFFLHNKDKLYSFIESYPELLLSNDTRVNKKPINFNKTIDNISITSINNDIYEDMFDETSNKSQSLSPLTNDNIIFSSSLSNRSHNHSLSSTSSSCSSNSSNTKTDFSDNNDTNSEYSQTNSSDNSDSTDDSENKFNITINKFPCNMIFLEKLDTTLDFILENDEQDEVELAAIMAQVIFTLIVYQKCFKFTHNDLHTNNIMFNKTDRKFIFYKCNNKVYKVPTYGRIFKIIDFGRAVYTFKGIKCVSDSFSHLGDAATQFNMEPYFNNKKPLIEENFSFDLCRLACSMYDFIISDDDKENENSPICRLINEWITDDKGKNILYKKNGDERYPEFKLYKMIVRTVHNHIPIQQLEKPIFEQFVTPKKRINKSVKIFNIDDLPDYTIDF
jgi:hypothetical protein